jgi:hypothetical protein
MDILMAELVVIASFIMSLFFAFNVWHVLIIFACCLIMLSSIYDIKKDLEMNVKFSLWKSLYMGKGKIIFAVVLVIASQYYGIVSRTNGPKNIPKFDTTSVTQKAIGPILSMMDPNFKSLKTEDITVDEYILQLQKGYQSDAGSGKVMDDIIDSQIPSNVTIEQRNVLKQNSKNQIAGIQSTIDEKNKQLILNEGRRQFSQLLGKNISGNEKIGDVFSGIVNQKINDFFEPGGVGQQLPYSLSFIFSIVLFLTVWSLSLFLFQFWVLFTMLIFKIFKKTGLIEIKMITVEREVLF